MKLLLSTLALVFVFTGCSTKTQNYKLRNLNAQQSAIIIKQQALIKRLNQRLKSTPKRSYINKISRIKRTKVKTLPYLQAPKKEIVLKKVEDSNYSSSYMYPGEKKKPAAKVVKKKATLPTVTSKPSSLMTKTECISMIGQEKFTKYTQMFGSESASLKRCKMLKAMKQ